MKKIHILLFAMAAMAAASCSEKEEMAPVAATGNQVQREFSAITTKTALQDDGATVVWETSDAISVFDGTSNNKFDIKDYTSPSASAKFEGTTEATATEFYAVYPYAAENTLDGNKVTGTVPAAQTAKTGSFDSGAAVAVAYTDADAFAFHNVTALIGVKLSSSQNNVSSIVLTGNCGESVAGAVTATLSSAGAVSAIASSSTGSKSVTLSGTFAAGGMYYLAFIPQNFSEGITVTANYSDGKSAKLVSSLDWDAEAGKSYNVVDFGTAAYLEFEAEKFTFDYGESKVVSFSGKNIASVDGIALPAGWTASELGTSSVKITAPVKTVVTENAAGTVYKPVGDAVLTVTTNSSATKNASVKVRLRGINSDEEFNEFRTLYQNGSDSFSGSGVSYNRRLTDCADYLVNEEITLNDDISATPEASSFKYYILHHIEHNLNGNGKTFTFNVAHDAYPIGFCQTIFGTVKVYDLKLAGTINWTYSAAGGNGGCCGGFVAQSQGNSVSLTLENIDNSVNINWTSASTADPTKNHAVGGFIGVWTGKPVTFVNCTYSGTITKNCRNLGVGGFIGWSSGTSVSKFDSCTFEGSINCNATTSKSAWTTSKNLEIVGGFVGCTDSKADGLVEFKGCESGGTIKFANGGRLIGGFVGKTACPATFADNSIGKHCVFSGTIDYTETQKSASNNGYGYIGGFVGQSSGQPSKSYENCEVSTTGLIKIVGGACRVGGYIGSNDYAIATFKNNTFSGTLDYTSGGFVSGSVERIGGMIGHKGGAKGTLTSCTCSGDIIVRAGAQSVGGIIAYEPVADVFNDCKVSGKIVYTVYPVLPSGTDARTQCGVVGGIYGCGSGDAVEIELNNCNVTSSASLTTTGDVTCLGGFAGNSGPGKATKLSLESCTFSGSMTHTAVSGIGDRRIGGFVGDAARQVALTDCTNSGTMVMHQNNNTLTDFNGFGGIIGRTTAAASGYTMKFDMTGCVFSGSMTVYNSPSSTSTYGYGTLIGTNVGYGVTTIDGAASGTSNASVNYGTTSVSFLTE